VTKTVRTFDAFSCLRPQRRALDFSHSVDFSMTCFFRSPRPTHSPKWNAVAMGKIQRLPRFVDDESDVVESARIMPISWGGDHRAVDGAMMARFSNLWKSYCENPSSMMFAMR
jgi:hypothetical protein